MEKKPTERRGKKGSRKSALPVLRMEADKDELDELMSKSVLNGLEAEHSAGALRPQKNTQLEKTTLGDKWYGLAKPTMTPELEREVQVLQLKAFMHRKRFFKRGANRTTPEYFEMGTIIEGPTEFHSGRLTRKERKSSMVDEVLADAEIKQYTKRRYLEIQKQSAAGGKNFVKEKKKKARMSY